MSQPTLASLTEFNNAVRNSVTNETSDFDANLFNLSIPGTDPDTSAGLIPSSINFTFLPKKRVILVSGIYQGTEVQMLAFVNEIETQARSSSQSERVYTNGIGKTYTIRINGFTYTHNVSNFNKLDYTIELFSEAT